MTNTKQCIKKQRHHFADKDPYRQNYSSSSSHVQMQELDNKEGCCCCHKVASVVSNSARPHRRKAIKLPPPRDSPGNNTGMGCHFILQCRKVKSKNEIAQSCPTPSGPKDCSLPGSSVHGIFQAKKLEWVAIAFSNKEG